MCCPDNYLLNLVSEIMYGMCSISSKDINLLDKTVAGLPTDDFGEIGDLFNGELGAGDLSGDRSGDTLKKVSIS